jgi:hypothetical protein
MASYWQPLSLTNPPISPRSGHSTALRGGKMRTYKFLLSLLIVYGACATAAEQSDRIGSKKLPVEAVRVCKERVYGDAAHRSIHINWEAYGLNEDTDKTAHFYQAQFGHPPAEDEGGRYTWRFKGEYSELIYSVQPSSSEGPWSACSNQPRKFKTTVLISNRIWTKEP